MDAILKDVDKDIGQVEEDFNKNVRNFKSDLRMTPKEIQKGN